MRHPRPSRLMAAASLATALSLTGCGDGVGGGVGGGTNAGGDYGGRARATTSASRPASATPSQAATSVKPDDGTTINATAAGGKVTTASRRVKVKRGDTVRLTVTSDVSDEIHVHTYDHKLFLQAGKPGTLEFKADIPGVIEVELDKSGLAVVELQVG